MEINTITALLAVVMMCMVAWGYIPLLTFGLSRWASWVFLGVVIIVVTIGSRLTYWDLLQHFSGDNWGGISAALGGQKISALFNVGLMVACGVLLQGRKLLIPKHDQHNWGWWNAWWHPREKCRIPWRKRK